MKLRRQITNGVIYAILGVLSLIWISPIVYLVLLSFKAEQGPYLIGYLFPKGYTLANYASLFTDTRLFNFPRWFGNTMIVAIFSTIIATTFVLSVAYALSRLRFRLRRPIMNIALVLGMFPGFMSIIAIYHLLKVLGLDKSLAALVLVYSGGAGLNYYITKGFFDTIPRALDEAAFLDGATRWQIFYKITLPMSKPIITYSVLTAFMAPWVDFIVASVVMQDHYQSYTVALGLYQMLERENVTQYFTHFCAGAVIVAIPIAAIFMIMQKNYVEGVTGGAVKG